MAFDDHLADRVRQRLSRKRGLSEKRMFGGLGFLLDGNMCCGILGEELIVRVGPERADAALEDSHARPFDFTGRPMRGWVFVAPAGVDSDSALDRWIELGVSFATSLPPK